MNIKVVLFASLRESLGEEGVTLTLDGVTSISELIQRLTRDKGPAWGLALSNETVLSAVDHIMVPSDHLLIADCEVAFFPPVTGG